MRFTGYGVITEKPRVGHLPPKFSVNPVGKTMRWIEKWLAPFWCPWRALFYHHANFREDHTTRAGCMCENVVFFCHAPSPEHCAFEGCIVRTSTALPFIDRLWRGFQLFHKELLFRMHYIVLIFVARWRHTFHEIAVKKLRKLQNRRKSLCAPLRIYSWEIWSLGPRM